MGYIKRERYIRVIGIFSTLAFILLFIYTFTPIYFRTDTAEGVSTNPPEPTITITSGHNTASLDLVVNSSNGTFATSSLNNSAQFSVATTNASGYTLTILGDGTGQLVSDTAGSSLSTIESALSQDTFSGNDATLYNGKWGYLPNKYNSETNTMYRPAPTTANTLDQTSTSGSNNYTIGVGVRTDFLKPSGTYENNFTLTATAKPAPYTINYLDNSSGTATPLLPADTGDSLTSEIELDDATPTKTGYTFGGWCDVVTTADATGSTTCPSGATTYQPGDDVDFIDFTTSTNVLNLYAIWTLKTHDVTVNFSDEAITDITFAATGYPTRTVSTSGGTVNLAEIATYIVTMNLAGSRYEFSSWSINDPDYGTLGATDENPTTFTPNAQSDNAVITGVAVSTLPPETIQEITYSTCSTTPKQVYDSRDEEVYWIARLADGKCWMLDNLRLGSTTEEIELTPADTNIESNWTLPTSVTTTTSSTESNRPRLNADYKDTAPTINYNLATSSNKIGVFYNTCASSAGTYCYTSTSGPFTEIEYDICPAGWRLSTSDSDGGEVGVLYNSYASGIDFARAFSITSTGYYFFNGPGIQYETSSLYMTQSTPASANGMYGFYGKISTSTTFTASFNTSFSRHHAQPVRCVLGARTINDIETFQDFGKLNAERKAMVVSSMTTDVNYTLSDNRDGRTYTVSKLDDGNVWMTQNLAFGYNAENPNVQYLTNTSAYNTNMADRYKTLNMYDLVAYSSSNCAGSSIYSGYTYMCMHSGIDSTNGEPTVWYNYPAATVGTVTGGSNTSESTNDICSVGWRLPTSTEEYGIRSYSASTTAFKPVKSGEYVDGVLDGYSERGYWWSSTPSSVVSGKTRNGLYQSNNTYLLLRNDAYQYYGMSIRCILKP